MGWLILAVLALLTGLGLWRFGALPRVSRDYLAAALLLGVAGYAWQGSPSLGGSPTPPKAAAQQPGKDFPKSPEGMVAKVGSDADVLMAAENLHDRGLDAYAIATIRAALNRRPSSADLWVGLGNALVTYSDGLIAPAARLAFERAAKLSPDHPGPPYFMGLAYAQAGQFEQAIAIWQALLARTPERAPWRPELEQRLAEVRMAQRQTGAGAR
ncbi:MAG TPA: tetratricopeptide repeat protein [Sphingomonadaceae bacterium]|nr:tetratricopeptide repeat protein [Sphingomonadaceae bacterium]